MIKQGNEMDLASMDPRARAFVDARLSATGVTSYPGEKPTTLSEAYEIQNSAVNAFPDTLVGWKVGGINGEWRDQLGVSRLLGPVYDSYRHLYSGASIDMPVFSEGFAAVEGEVTAVISKDVPADKTSLTREEAIGFIGSLHLGVEIASSPFAEINDHGPLVTISDFGNNRGLILGDEIPEWQNLDIESWEFETCINGQSVGKAVPNAMPGGPIESIRYALENTSQRGFCMKAGMMILTGAVTGVHRAYPGDQAVVSLNGKSSVQCNLTSL